MFFQKCNWSIIYAFICILLICNIICVSRCTRIYSNYSENFRDTIYIEHRNGVKTIQMAGLPDGIVQKVRSSGLQINSYKYMIIRELYTSKLDTIMIGDDDYYYIEEGDTILGSIKNMYIDTVIRFDTIFIHIENANNKAKAYVLKGFPNGIVVEGKCNINSKTKEPISNTCTLTIRSLSNSKLINLPVGKYDYDRINLGDTIYGQ
ncbi:MAG: hypothetical protein [Wendovervirus sonii]|uniref:Uncharacterized protein n=1 Tax=phage Lak_Megaphage_Sonny TaxID=3109229 RepID=A0ABZ0Z3I0_9CAUD|nr:MAG: hypothetical protein [phage Lak_Megaphage_Sonny]